jgi:hypothetical protein
MIRSRPPSPFPNRRRVASKRNPASLRYSTRPERLRPLPFTLLLPARMLSPPNQLDQRHQRHQRRTPSALHTPYYRHSASPHRAAQARVS